MFIALPFFHPSVCSKVFLEATLVLLKLSMVVGTHVALCLTEPDFLRRFFCGSKYDPKMT